MRSRIWIFTAVVAIALAVNLARISLSIAQTGEDTMRARVAAASNALRGQLDLLDARAAPRSIATMPDLIEAVRGEEGQPPPRPDERALRAAAAALAPEPDLFAVVTPKGAILSRRAHPAQTLDDPGKIPLAQTATGSLPAPTFAAFDNAVYRFAAARVPGVAAAVVVGTLVDDRLAAQLKSQIDADVTFLQGGRLLASSLPQGDDRVRLQQWTAAPGPGYGVLPVRLPFVGAELSGKLPRGALRYAVRGALIPLEAGTQAAITVPASPYLSWLGRYQAFYLLGLALLVILGFVWGLLARAPAPIVQQVPAPLPEPVEPDDGIVSPPRRAPRTPSLIGADIGEPRPEPVAVRDVPWSPGEGPSGEHPVIASASLGEPLAAPPPPPLEVEPGAAKEAAQQTASAEAAGEAFPAVAERAGEGEAVGIVGLGSAGAAVAVHAEPEVPPLEAAAWGAPAAEPAGGSAPEWQMPSLPPDALASEGGDRGPVLGQILDPLVPPPAASELAAPEPLGAPAGAEAAEGGLAAAEGAPAGPAAAPPAEQGLTMQDFSMPGVEEPDPDELHWRETYDRFRELKLQLGEPADRISFEKFAAKLKKNRADLLAKHHCKGVRFSVYEKDGKAAIKASAIR